MAMALARTPEPKKGIPRDPESLTPVLTILPMKQNKGEVDVLPLMNQGNEIVPWVVCPHLVFRPIQRLVNALAAFERDFSFSRPPAREKSDS
jgi:hypothetical protein